MGYDLAMEHSVSSAVITFYVDNAFTYESATLELKSDEFASLTLSGVRKKDDEAWRTLEEFATSPLDRGILLRFYWRGHYFHLVEREQEIDYPPIASPRAGLGYEELQLIGINRDYAVKYTFRLEGSDLALNNGADLA